MEKKKERILMLSLKRQQQVEDSRRVKEMEMQRKRDEEAMKQEEKLRKREEEKARRQAILETYRMKKQDEMEKDVSWSLCTGLLIYVTSIMKTHTNLMLFILN